MAERRQVSTTITAEAWIVFLRLTEKEPYHSQTDVVSAALVAFGSVPQDEQLGYLLRVREAKLREIRTKRRQKRGNKRRSV